MAEEIKILAGGVVKTSMGHVFERNGIKFAWHDPKNREFNLEFTHLASGLGFNGLMAKSKAKMEASFDGGLERIGTDKFWETVNNMRSLEDSLERMRAKAEKNAKNRELVIKLGEIMHEKVDFCRWSLMAGSVTLDVIALDNRLKNRYRTEYIENEMSMRDFVTKKWGEDVAKMIEEAIKVV